MLLNRLPSGKASAEARLVGGGTGLECAEVLRQEDGGPLAGVALGEGFEGCAVAELAVPGGEGATVPGQWLAPIGGILTAVERVGDGAEEVVEVYAFVTVTVGVEGA